MSDLREIESCPLPTVAAQPLPHDISTWHVNLRPADGPFEGSIFHFRLRFPPDYPANPPSVEMLSSECSISGPLPAQSPSWASRPLTTSLARRSWDARPSQCLR